MASFKKKQKIDENVNKNDDKTISFDAKSKEETDKSAIIRLIEMKSDKLVFKDANINVLGTHYYQNIIYNNVKIKI